MMLFPLAQSIVAVSFLASVLCQDSSRTRALPCLEKGRDGDLVGQERPKVGELLVEATKNCEHQCVVSDRLANIR
jgi:hypothetical protein